MPGLKQVRHIAIIATDYTASEAFYCGVFGFILMSETYQEERDSWEGDLALDGQHMIRPFSFLFPSYRPNRSEVCGLRHLAFSVEDVGKSIVRLETHHVKCKSIRIDSFVGKRFMLFNDPDGLPLELYEL